MPTPTKRLRRLLKGPRTAILLYAVLVLLPAAVFGALLWDQLEGDHRRTLQEAPREVRDASSRLATEVHRRLGNLLQSESLRSFAQYADTHLVTGADGTVSEVPSPLRDAPRPDGIAGWFQFDSAERYEAEIQLYLGERPGIDAEARAGLEEWLRVQAVDYASGRYNSQELFLDALLDREEYWLDSHERVVTDLATIAHFTHQGAPGSCDLDEVRRFIEPLVGIPHPVVQKVSLHLLPGPDGQATLLLLRDVIIQNVSPGEFALSTIPGCLEALRSKQHWVQGLWLTPEWLWQTMPQGVADTVLADRQRLFLRQPPGNSGDWQLANVNLLEGSTCCGARGTEPGPLDRRHERLRDRQPLPGPKPGGSPAWRASCSFRACSDCGCSSAAFACPRRTHAARRTSSPPSPTNCARRSRWSSSTARCCATSGSPTARSARTTQRASSTSNRLALLVDRVLEKRRLSGGPEALISGNLNAEIRSQFDVLGLESARDVAFELADDLPTVLLRSEGVHTVLSNLIENARKYAPVTPENPEPILVRTRVGKGKWIWLEVADRGKGIPPHERGRVLEAFYRIGNEATRSKPGTGLGLNLCAQSMRAMRGNIEVLARPGGGTLIRAGFRRG
ncbi:MAG: sensor histidine kinase [Planctomycetota bacterium]